MRKEMMRELSGAPGADWLASASLVPDSIHLLKPPSAASQILIL